MSGGQQPAGTGAPRVPRPHARDFQIPVSMSGAWEWDTLHDRLTGDDRFAYLCGLDPAQAADGLPTSAFFAAVHPQDLMRVRLAIAGALHGVELFSKEYRVNRRDGMQSWVIAQGRAVLNAEGEVILLAGVLSDISDQKRLRDQLKIAQTAGGVGTFEYSSGFGTADVSEQFCQLLGLQPADILPVRTINSVIHPDDPPLLGHPDNHVPGPSFREFRIRRADSGEERWLARRGENRPNGGPTGFKFIGVIYDVTVAKVAERQLVKLTEALAERVEAKTQERDRLWNLSRDLFAVLTPEGRCQAVNPAWDAVLGYAESEVIGERLEAFVLRDDVESLAALLAALAAGKPAPDFSCRMCAKDGSLKCVDWNIVFSDGAYHATGRDITARRQLEEQLRQSQKMEAIGQLTGGLAHDFNNMLTGIMGGIDIVRRRISQGRTDDLDRFMDTSMASAQRAAALTQRLLAFARRQSLDSHAVMVDTLIGSIEELLHRTLGEQILLKTEIQGNIWPVLADANQLESAILNLVLNSRDAMPQGGALTIFVRNVSISEPTEAGAAAAGDYVEIGISDTGTGMPPEVVANAFDPFYTTKPIGQGTGLGLSMVYGFVQQSKGHVAIESRVGAGTTVSIFLPRTAAEPAPPEAIQPPPAGGGEVVLVVEDDPSVRLLVVEVLSELGYDALEAENAQRALDLLRRPGRLDLMISDVGLPGLNGRQLADLVRQEHPALPILFMTGYAPDARVRTEFLAAGMQMIEKPFVIEVLAGKIRAMLAEGDGTA